MAENIIQIYTDGSCHTRLKVGAWAAIIMHNGERSLLKGTEENTTHHRMEMIAVINSIGFSQGKNPDARINVFTDSQYVCDLIRRKDRLKANNFKTKKGNQVQNADLVIRLIELIESIEPEFIKLKAHEVSAEPSAIYNREVDIISRRLVRERVRNMH